MNIELATPTSVKITWPRYDDGTEAEIVKRLGTVPGSEGRGRRYYAPIIQVYRLMELFPRGSYQYEALAAADGTAQAFFAQLVHFDLELIFDESGAICAVGRGVSPLIQQLVDERAHALRPLVAEAVARPKAQRPARPSTIGVDDERLGPLFRGIQNAKKKAEAEQFKYPKRRRKKAKVPA